MSSQWYTYISIHIVIVVCLSGCTRFFIYLSGCSFVVCVYLLAFNFKVSTDFGVVLLLDFVVVPLLAFLIAMFFALVVVLFFYLP